jgi:hydrogenase nickel incorporation protein HypB
MHRTAVKKVILENVLDANDTLARANRDAFDKAGTYTINMMSSPGAGKTALLERTLERLRGELRLGVLEGDVQTTLDADRLARFHIPLVQVNTDPGFGGECHLDANMVRSGLGELPLDDIDILVIENVGNLVCPAEFRVGEDVRVMVYSVTEGEEKPLKYPLMFRSAHLVLVNKVDLLEYLEFDLEQFLGNLDAVNPGVGRILTSARTGQGVDEWCEWLGQRIPERRRG